MHSVLLFISFSPKPRHLINSILFKMAQKLVGFFLTPWMRPVDDEPLEEDSGDLLLDGLLVGLGEQEEKGAGKVLGVGVGVPQLVGDGVEEEVASLRLQVHSQVLEYVHVRGVRDRLHGRAGVACKK